MFMAVVPAQNEEYRLGRVLERLLSIDSIAQIFVILNGSNTLTQQEAQAIFVGHKNRVTLVSFREPLGIDVPRSVGAKLAYVAGASYTLFVDGDMVGEFTDAIYELLQNAQKHTLDLTLMNCYPDKHLRATFYDPLFYWRQLLNKELGLFEPLHIATPSHGPHVVSRKMMSLVPWEDFAVPPTLLVHGVKHHLSMNTGCTLPHIELGSSIKNHTHRQLIIDTIIGDCLEALCMLEDDPRLRYHEGRMYQGYHPDRRFDLLRQFLAGRFMN